MSSGGLFLTVDRIPWSLSGRHPWDGGRGLRPTQCLEGRIGSFEVVVALDGAPSYLAEVARPLAARVLPGARREATDVDPLAGGSGACGLG